MRSKKVLTAPLAEVKDLPPDCDRRRASGEVNGVRIKKNKPLVWKEPVVLDVGAASSRDHFISRLEAAPTGKEKRQAGHLVGIYLCTLHRSNSTDTLAPLPFPGLVMLSVPLLASTKILQ